MNLIYNNWTSGNVSGNVAYKEKNYFDDVTTQLDLNWPLEGKIVSWISISKKEM